MLITDTSEKSVNIKYRIPAANLNIQLLGEAIVIPGECILDYTAPYFSCRYILKIIQLTDRKSEVIDISHLAQLIELALRTQGDIKNSAIHQDLVVEISWNQVR